MEPRTVQLLAFSLSSPKEERVGERRAVVASIAGTGEAIGLAPFADVLTSEFLSPQKPIAW